MGRVGPEHEGKDGSDSARSPEIGQLVGIASSTAPLVRARSSAENHGAAEQGTGQAGTAIEAVSRKRRTSRRPLIRPLMTEYQCRRPMCNSCSETTCAELRLGLF